MTENFWNFPTDANNANNQLFIQQVFQRILNSQVNSQFDTTLDGWICSNWTCYFSIWLNQCIFSFQFDDILQFGWQEVNQGTRNIIQQNVRIKWKNSFIYTKIKCLFVKCALFVLFPNLTENWRNVVNRARSFALKQCTPIFLFFRHYHSCSWIYHCVPDTGCTNTKLYICKLKS